MTVRVCGGEVLLTIVIRSSCAFIVVLSSDCLIWIMYVCHIVYAVIYVLYNFGSFYYTYYSVTQVPKARTNYDYIIVTGLLSCSIRRRSRRLREL